VDPEQINAYGLGWFPEDEWPPYVEEGESEAADQYRNWSGKGVRLRGKLFLPLHDPAGHVVGFQLRTPSHEEKDYSRFQIERSKAQAVLFGVRQAMPHIWETGEVYLVEGSFDLFPMARIRPNTVAVGTSRLMGRQREFVRRFADRVCFAFDMDEQGEMGFQKFRDDYGSELEVIRVTFDGNDVADAWRRVGDAGLEEAVRLSVDPLGLRGG